MANKHSSHSCMSDTVIDARNNEIQSQPRNSALLRINKAFTTRLRISAGY